MATQKGKKKAVSYSREAALWKKGYPIYKELREAGVPHMYAIGILGNMALESSFNPDAKSDSGTYTGYVQNSTDISNYIKKYYGGYGHREQMQYILDGLNGKLRGGKTSIGRQMQTRFNNFKSRMASIDNPTDAAKAWEQAYEKSGGQAMKARIRYADYFNRMVGNPSSPTPVIPYKGINVAPVPDNEMIQRYLNATKPEYTPITIEPIPQPVSLFIDDLSEPQQIDLTSTPTITSVPMDMSYLETPQLPIQQQKEFSYFNDPYENYFFFT